MIELEVTTFTAAVLGLLYVWLSLRVSQGRMALKIPLGDGGNEAMTTRMRTHANFIEYVPLILILMLLIERQIGYSVGLGVASAATILGRLLHVWGMGHPAPNAGRAGGTTLTWLTILGLSVWALILALRII